MKMGERLVRWKFCVTLERRLGRATPMRSWCRLVMGLGLGKRHRCWWVYVGNDANDELALDEGVKNAGGAGEVNA